MAQNGSFRICVKSCPAHGNQSRRKNAHRTDRSATLLTSFWRCFALSQTRAHERWPDPWSSTSHCRDAQRRGLLSEVIDQVLEEDEVKLDTICRVRGRCLCPVYRSQAGQHINHGWIRAGCAGAGNPTACLMGIKLAAAPLGSRAAGHLGNPASLFLP